MKTTTSLFTINLKSSLFFLLFALLQTLSLSAVENVVLTDGRVLFNIEVVGESPEFVVIEHREGTDSYDWALMPNVFKKKYQTGYSEPQPVETVAPLPVEIETKAATNYLPTDPVEEHDAMVIEAGPPLAAENASNADLVTTIVQWAKANIKAVGIGFAVLAFILFYLFR